MYLQFFLWRRPLSPRRATSGKVPYSKTLFHNNSYECVYSLARLHTNFHNYKPNTLLSYLLPDTGWTIVHCF